MRKKPQRGKLEENEGEVKENEEKAEKWGNLKKIRKKIKRE